MSDDTAGKVLVERDAIVDRSRRELHTKVKVRCDIAFNVQTHAVALADILQPSRQARTFPNRCVESVTKVSAEAEAGDLWLSLSRCLDRRDFWTHFKSRCGADRHRNRFRLRIRRDTSVCSADQ